MKISKKLFYKHKESCDKIKKQMPEILKEFDKQNHGIYKISVERHLNFECLSKQFKKLGIQLNIDENGKYPRQYFVNDNYFDIMDWEQYWLLGLLASDGSIEKDHYVTLSQSGEDGLQLIKYVNNILQNECPIRERKTKYKIAYGLYFSSPKITNILKKYNIIKNKTYNFKFPNIPNEFLKAFLIGYIQGDGCISFTNKKDIHFSISFVGTPNFVKSISQKIPFVGHMSLKGKNKKVMEWRIGGKKALKFGDWLFENWNGFVNYKYKHYLEYKQYSLNKYLSCAKIKEEILKTLQEDPLLSIMKYAEKINVSYQTIYGWKKEWTKQGLLKNEYKKNIGYSKIKPEIKERTLKILQENPTINIKKYAKEIGVSKSTIYCWKNKWKKEGLL